MKYSILPRTCTHRRASRLRKTYLCNKLHFPTSVSSTPHAHLKKQVSSRLHQMLVFLKNDVSLTPNTYFGQRIAPSDAIEDVDFCGDSCKCMRPVYVNKHIAKNCTFQRVSRLHQMHIRKMQCRLVYVKCHLFCKRCVSPTPNATFEADPSWAARSRTGLGHSSLLFIFVLFFICF